MIDKALLEKLSNAVAVANAEGEVRKMIHDAVVDRVIEPVIDAMGNLIVRRVGTGKIKLRVLLTAHMDETGFMVTDTADNGLITVEPMGKHDLRYVPTQRVVIGKDNTPGVFIFAPIHKSQGKNDLQAVDDMHIDVGASGKPNVKLGDRAAYLGNYRQITDQVVTGKAFESRAAIAVLIALLKGAPFPFDLYVAFTAQRTVLARGARVAARRVRPDIAIALSGTEADDLPRDPDEADRAAVVRLGGGPVLHLIDSTAVLDRTLLAHFRNAAGKLAIPLQLDTIAGVSEGSRISSDYAALSASVGIPIRYMTSPHALLDLTDLDRTENLLREALNSLTPDLLKKDVTA